MLSIFIIVRVVSFLGLSLWGCFCGFLCIRNEGLLVSYVWFWCTMLATTEFSV